MGHLIKQKLRELKLTNEWLRKQLSHAGYNICSETLCRYLNGKRKSEEGDRILSAAWEIIKDFDKQTA